MSNKLFCTVFVSSMSVDDHDEIVRLDQTPFSWISDQGTPSSIPNLPDGYVYDRARRRICRQGYRRVIAVCGPMRCAFYLTNAAMDRTFLLIDFLDREGRERHHIVSQRDLQRRPLQLSVALADAGLEIFATAPKFAAFLRAWRPSRRGHLADALGWNESQGRHGFRLRDGTNLAPRNSGFELHFPNPALLCQAPTGGTLETWQRDVAGPAETNPLLMFAIAAALAGPLLDLLDHESIGFNFRASPLSGKSALLAAAQSCWDAPGPLIHWQSPQRAIELAMSRARDTVMVIDGQPTTRSNALQGLIERILSGEGRSRPGEAAEMATPERFATVLLSAAGNPMARTLRDPRPAQPDPLAPRVLDIPADDRAHGIFDDLASATNAAAFAEGLRASCARAHGHAGAAFAEQVITTFGSPRQRPGLLALQTDAIGWITDALGASDADTDTDLGPDLSTDRVIGWFAAVATAAELARTFGIVSWPRDRLRANIVSVAKSWHERYAKRPSPPAVETLVAELTDFVDDTAGNCLARLDRSETFEPGRHVGWITEEHVEIRTDIFAQRFCAQITAPKAARLLADIGLLVPGPEARSLQHRPSPLVDPRRIRVYRFRRSGLRAASETPSGPDGP